MRRKQARKLRNRRGSSVLEQCTSSFHTAAWDCLDAPLESSNLLSLYVSNRCMSTLHDLATTSSCRPSRLHACKRKLHVQASFNVQAYDHVETLGEDHLDYGHSGCVNALCWSHDGQFLASGSDDTRICLWKIDHEQGGSSRPLNGQRAQFRHVTGQHSPLNLGLQAV